MNLQPSKLSIAASQVWNESTSLFAQNKADNIKVDLDLGKKLTDTSKNDESKTMVTTSGYVFGSRLTERTKLVSLSKTDNVDEKEPKDVSSIFKKIAEKSAGDSTNLWKSAPSTNDNPSSSSDRLKESANEFEKKSQIQTDISSTDPIMTGEEEEKTVANISCKFFYFNPETKTWVERGMGWLKMNQHRSTGEIRLVGRTTGSQRVIINSKIFAGMVLEQISEKRIKISAKNADAELPQLFLVHSTASAISTIQPLLEKYIANAKSNSPSTASSAPRKRKTGDDREDENDDEAESKKKFAREEEEESEESNVSDESGEGSS